MATTRAAGITAAAGTRLTQPFLSLLFKQRNSLLLRVGTRDPLIALSRIVKVSRLLRPVGPDIMSQISSPGYCSHNPYPSWASQVVTLTTT